MTKQSNYSVNVVVTDIGWISDQAQLNVATAINNSDSVIHFTTDLHELHLWWPLLADTLDNAIDEARTTLRDALDAMGAACPRPRKFEVYQIGQ